jgi:hypothetical protein
MDWETLVFEGLEARQMKDKAQWKLGDLALQVETTYGEHSLEKYAEMVVVNHNSLQEYRRVAKAYEKSTRVDNLTWAHHRAIAAHPERQQWLTAAKDQRWSVSRMLTEARAPLPIDGDWSFTHQRIVGETLPGQPELQGQVIQKAREEGLSHIQIQEVAKAVKQVKDPRDLASVLNQPVTLTAEELTHNARAERLLTAKKRREST